MLESFRDEFAVPIQPQPLPTLDMNYIHVRGSNKNETRISGYVDGIDAYRKAVYKTFRTPRYIYPIYDNNHGSEFHLLIGRTAAYARARLPQMVHDCLVSDERYINSQIISITEQNFKSLRVLIRITATVGVFDLMHDINLTE
ncbi:MAG: DUF2634 domain-containing protein [Defluviitaleaceae bacterium]|nr:DUF2634 domain-containing protein [Defluviitaleaceae bacterium]MCL2261694.1 DUF2634 domain-containing protein [Defluviitaleaceae bacterium]